MNPQSATRATALTWLAEGRRAVAAMLVEVIGSAPLDPGAIMLVDEQRSIEGSVTGGCIEGALVEEAEKVLAGGPAKLLTYGISDELAGDVGLMCGGTVRVLVAELTPDVKPAITAALSAAQAGQPAALATLLDGPAAGRRLAVVDGEVIGGFGVADLLNHSVARDAAGLLSHGVSMVRRYGSDGATMGDELRVFVRSFAPPPRMVIFGAIDFSAALAILAREIGYTVTICDARQPFLESSRFSRAAEVVSQWPDRYLAEQTLGVRDVVLVFTHDPKFDEPALIAALASGAGYIGALGSRRTQADRRRRLSALGVAEGDLDRIVGPCGLDIGAGTPMETAISILGEIIALRSERAGERLTETDGTIRGRAHEHIR